MIMFGGFVGTIIGGFVPDLWHAGMFSPWGLLFATLGGVAGVFAAARLSDGL